MKIAFYVAHYPSEEITQYPLGIGYLAATIASKLNVSLENMLFARRSEEIVSFKPDVLAISSVSQVFDNAVQVAKVCREATDCFTIIGGYHISSLPHLLPKTIDIGVIGEGENTLTELIRYFDKGEPNIDNIKQNIKGICYHSNNTILCNPPRPLIEDIDTLPHPVRSGAFIEDAYLFTSRGCPYRCTFCASCQFWGKIRYHSAEYVLDEIRQLINRHKARSINILDDVFIANKERFFSIAEGLLREGLHKRISFHGFVRANLADEEIVKTLKMINFNSIRFGAETGSEKLLKYLKKGTVTTEQNQAFIDLCNKYDLPVGCSFVFGTPGETENDLKETTNFIEKNKDKAIIMGFYLLQAVPGTELWSWAKEKCLVSEDMDWSKLSLDLQKREFSWKNANYLNEEILPLNKFKEIVEGIRNRFLSDKRVSAFQRKNSFDELLSRLTGVYSGKKIFVEVGSGGSPRQGYIHCDIYPAPHVEYICKAWEIPFGHESIDEVYARHVLEHLTYKDALRSLRHWLAVLKVGGRIDINVPDLEKHIEQLKMDGNSPYVNLPIANKDHAMAGIYGWQRNDRDIHKWGYSHDSLSLMLRRTGFANIEIIVDNSVSGPMNLRIIAEKISTLPKLLPDHDSQRPSWTYYNWKGFLKKISRRLKISELAMPIISHIHNLLTLFMKDYSSNGDRQVSPDIDGIRKDHTERYRFACQFIKEGDKVLDCACGVGYGSYIMSQMTDASLIIAVDKAKEAIEYAGKHYYNSRIQHYVGDIFAGKLSFESFDVIVSFETIEHVDGKGLLRLFYTRLKKGGLLIISTPNQDKQAYNQREFPTHLRHYTPEEFDNILSSTGFVVAEKHTQHDREKEYISTGWNGLFNIAVARKV
ncbi:MAG: methyltransferase domain-containing protein [Proteobacteria bacterium]|nr:methyltransferase domain-containing protein [Pseudomonadota bacterium]